MTDYRSDFPLLTSRGFRKDVGMEHDWIMQQPRSVRRLSLMRKKSSIKSIMPIRYGAIIPLALKQRRCMKMPVRQCVILLEQNR